MPRLLCALSLVCCTEGSLVCEWPLCRPYVPGSLGSWLEPGAQVRWEARCTVHGDPLFLPAPFIWRPKAFVDLAGNTPKSGDPAGRPEPPEELLGSCLGEGDINSSAHGSSGPERPHSSPNCFVHSLSCLLFRNWSFSLQLTHWSNCRYQGVFEFSIFLCLCHLGPLCC